MPNGTRTPYRLFATPSPDHTSDSELTAHQKRRWAYLGRLVLARWKRFTARRQLERLIRQLVLRGRPQLLFAVEGIVQFLFEPHLSMNWRPASRQAEADQMVEQDLEGESGSRELREAWWCESETDSPSANEQSSLPGSSVATDTTPNGE